MMKKCISNDAVLHERTLTKPCYNKGLVDPSLDNSYVGLRFAVRLPEYLVIDLSKGLNATSYPVMKMYGEPVDGWTNEYKTDKLVLRRIEAGAFNMGSLNTETGRWDDEVPHKVTLTKPYYIGVFEVTQKQWSLVMETDPSQYKDDARPVERVSYNMIRGTVDGAQWPSSAGVDATSFMGKLRVKTSLDFDLPTEAQWEYACRAGTTTALNSGKNLTGEGDCPEMTKVGRYSHNQSDGRGDYSSRHTTVGSYKPNAWGLYDMHGNVDEWCLDGYVGSLWNVSVTDPVGSTLGSLRLVRGGSWFGSARYCRSAFRGLSLPSFSDAYIGLRVSVPLEK